MKAIRVLLKLFMCIFIRSAFCKFSIPLGGCDGPLCPVAIGKEGDCAVTANTEEQKAWCEHAWNPHFKEYGLDVPCSEENNFLLMRCIGGVELIATVLLWTSYERIGTLALLVIMIGAVHMHMIKLGDTLDKIVFPQLILVASLVVLLLIPSSSSSVAATVDDRKSK